MFNIICQVCDGCAASFSCETCKTCFCEQCEVYHRSNKATKDHIVSKQPPTEYTPTAVAFTKSETLVVKENGQCFCIAKLDDCKFLLVDRTEEKFIVYDAKEQCITGTFDPEMDTKSINMVTPVPGTTQAIIATKDTGLVFLDYNTMKAGKYLRFGMYYSVAVIDRKVYAGLYKEIQVFDISGLLLKKVKFSDHRYSAIHSICKGPNNTIICTDSKNLYCLDEDLKEKWFYSSDELPFVSCFVGNDGSIYVFSRSKLRLHQLSPDGMVLNDDILDEYIESENVGNVCYNDDVSEIYIQTSEPISIHVYKRNSQEIIKS